MMRPSDFFTLPVEDWVDEFVKGFLVPNFRHFFRAIEVPVTAVLQNLDAFLNWLPMLVFTLIVTAVAWRTAGRGNAVFAFIALCFIDVINLWSETMTTLAMIITAVVFCALIGVPLGILSAASDRFPR